MIRVCLKCPGEEQQGREFRTQGLLIFAATLRKIDAIAERSELTAQLTPLR